MVALPAKPGAGEAVRSLGGQSRDAHYPVRSYGYLLHNFYPPENRRAIVFYVRATEWKAGGNGKSIVAKSFQHIKPWHFVNMKLEKKGSN